MTINFLLATSARLREWPSWMCDVIAMIGTTNHCWLVEIRILLVLLELPRCIYIRILLLLCMLSMPRQKEPELSQSSLEHKTWHKSPTSMRLWLSVRLCDTSHAA